MTHPKKTLCCPLPPIVHVCFSHHYLVIFLRSFLQQNKPLSMTLNQQKIRLNVISSMRLAHSGGLSLFNKQCIYGIRSGVFLPPSMSSLLHIPPHGSVAHWPLASSEQILGRDLVGSRQVQAVFLETWYQTQCSKVFLTL